MLPHVAVLLTDPKIIRSTPDAKLFQLTTYLACPVAIGGRAGRTGMEDPRDLWFAAVTHLFNAARCEIADAD
jgi:hypothetical protein